MIEHSREDERTIVMGLRSSTLESVFHALLGAIVLAALAASPIFAQAPQARGHLVVADLRSALPPAPVPESRTAPGAQVDLGLLTRISVHGPDRLRPELQTNAPRADNSEVLAPVLRAIQREASGDEFLRAELARQLKEELPGGGSGVTLGRIRMTPPRDLPKGDWNVSYDLRLPTKGTGTVVFTGRIRQAGREIKRFNGSARIDRRATGVQVRRLIRRGERIGPGDLIAMPARLSRLPNDALQSQDSLSAGTVARSELRPGVWLTGRMIKLQTAVRTRQLVTMRLDKGGIRIDCKGIVKQNGALGDIIRVQNTQSDHEVMARVISNELVEVVF